MSLLDDSALFLRGGSVRCPFDVVNNSDVVRPETFFGENLNHFFHPLF